MNIEKIRKDFPILEKQTYLNTAATGPLLTKVKDAVVNWWDSRENQQYVDLPNTRAEVAKLINCDTNSVALVHRASQGINIVSSLVNPGKGENIILTDLSYPSSVYPWIGNQESGVEIKRINNKRARSVLHVQIIILGMVVTVMFLNCSQIIAYF